MRQVQPLQHGHQPLHKFSLLDGVWLKTTNTCSSKWWLTETKFGLGSLRFIFIRKVCYKWQCNLNFINLRSRKNYFNILYGREGAAVPSNKIFYMRKEKTDFFFVHPQMGNVRGSYTRIYSTYQLPRATYGLPENYLLDIEPCLAVWRDRYVVEGTLGRKHRQQIPIAARHKQKLIVQPNIILHPLLKVFKHFFKLLCLIYVILKQ